MSHKEQPTHTRRLGVIALADQVRKSAARTLSLPVWRWSHRESRMSYAEEGPMSIRRGSMLVAALLWAAYSDHVHAASCAPEALAEIRAAMEPVCPCLGAATFKAYKGCVKKGTKALQTRLPSLTNPCRKAMMHVAESSTCGRSGKLVCCRGTTKSGKAKDGAITNSADACVRKKKGEACQGAPSDTLGIVPNSTIDCDATGRCPTTTTTTTTITTSMPTTTTTPPCPLRETPGLPYELTLTVPAT